MSLFISVKAEEIFRIGEVPITNSLILTFGVSFLILVGALIYWTKSRKAKYSLFKATIDWLLETLYNFIRNVAGEEVNRFFPLLATFFIFILLSNWSGLIPGVGAFGLKEMVDGKEELIPLLRGPTADLNTTLALALISVFTVQIFGFKALGFSYLKKFFNFTNPINIFVGFLELISQITKVFSFSFRLFGNIFAGEVLLSVIAFLLPFLAPLPFLCLEFFVGFIQALVFTMLSLVFMTTAMESEEKVTNLNPVLKEA